MHRHVRRIVIMLAGLVAAALLPCGCTAVNPRSKETLARVAAEASKDLPKMFNAEIELSSVEGLEGMLVYHYRLVNQSVVELDASAYAARLKPAVVEQSCGSANMRSRYLEMGVTVRYDYVDRDQRPVAQIDVTDADCGS